MVVVSSSDRPKSVRDYRSLIELFGLLVVFLCFRFDFVLSFLLTYELFIIDLSQIPYSFTDNNRVYFYVVLFANKVHREQSKQLLTFSTVLKIIDDKNVQMKNVDYKLKKKNIYTAICAYALHIQLYALISLYNQTWRTCI